MTKEELKAMINEEKKMYSFKPYFRLHYVRNRRYLIWKCLMNFRKFQYYQQERNSFNNSKLMRGIYQLYCYYFLRKSNRFGCLVGIELTGGASIGRRCNIYHGGVVINGIIGDDCIIHGNNVIGNKGLGKESERPVIGNGVDIGAGAVIIGDVYIADECVIGANAVVVKSFSIPGEIIVGVPAKSKGKS